MATLPNVQSNIQAIAQANSPFTANNGNPGTVYNMPNTGGYKAPMASALNQWALNPTGGSIYANNQFWTMPPAAGGAGQGPFFTLPPVGTTVTPPPSVIVNPPVVPPTVTPPTTPPYTVGGGGVVDPSIYTQPPANGGSPAGGIFNPGPLGTVVSNRGTSGSNYTHTAPSTGFGGLGNALGDSGITWQGVLGTVLGADLYDAASGKWDITNGAALALNQVFPGLGTAAQWAMNNGLLGQKLQDFAFDESYRQFEARQAQNVAQAGNDAAAHMTTVTNNLMNLRNPSNAFGVGGLGWNSQFGAPTGGLGTSPFDSEYNGTILDRMEGWANNAAPARDSRSGNSTGSGVVWSAENGGNFAGGNERAYLAELDALKLNPFGIGVTKER